MSREEILLKEYEICQLDSNAMITTHWTVAGIMMAVVTGLGGALISVILAKPIGVENPTKWLVLLVSILAIVIIIISGLWLLRVNHLVHINNVRMSQIETQLGMAKNRLADIIGRWRSLSFGDRRRLRLGGLYPMLLNGEIIIFCLYLAVALFWVVLDVLVFFIL